MRYTAIYSVQSLAERTPWSVPSGVAVRRAPAPQWQCAALCGMRVGRVLMIDSCLHPVCGTCAKKASIITHTKVVLPVVPCTTLQLKMCVATRHDATRAAAGAVYTHVYILFTRAAAAADDMSEARRELLFLLHTGIL